MSTRRKVVRLELVRNQRLRENSQFLRAKMHGAVDAQVKKLGDSLAGFVIIAWDHDGNNPMCCYSADIGSVGHGMLPSFVHDTINRSLAIDAAVSGDDEIA